MNFISIYKKNTENQKNGQREAPKRPTRPYIR